MRNHLELYSDDNLCTVYKHKTDFIELSVVLDKTTKMVNITEMMFIKTSDEDWKPQDSDWVKHSCKYGHWQKNQSMEVHQDDLKHLIELCSKSFT